ncbi:FecR domain-containing protein [Verticiella sediminum]|uniref:FecR domain-containing protein n=2 Tax=Verticiella sediminum TaxID=1247510 RepID=UPI0031F186F6
MSSRSSTRSGPQIDASARALRDAADWFARLRDGQATQDEHARWHAWIEADPAHRAAWTQIAAVGARLAPLRGEGAAAADAALRRPRMPARRAALLGVAALTGATAAWSLRPDSPARRSLAWWQADQHTATGEIRRLALPDGSELWLNTASAVDLDFGAGRRVVYLRAGQILVQTAPAPAGAPPFLVETAQGRLRALGTRFSVRDDAAEGISLAVYEGAVAVRAEPLAPERILPSGASARFLRSGSFALGAAGMADAAWTRGVLLADGRTLREVLAELSRHRRGVIRVAPEVADLQVIGGFPLNDPDRTLAMLEGVLPIRVRRGYLGWRWVEPR